MPEDINEVSLEIADVQPFCTGITIDKKIGDGGQKQVFRGLDSEGKRVAVKLVKIDYFWFGTQTIMPDSETKARAEREIELMKKYNSPYLPTLYSDEVSEVKIGGFTYMIFSENYAGDKSLLDLISDADAATNPKVSVEMVVKMVHDVGEALALYSQDGIVHRDIKPQNIVYSADEDVFVLIDGGVHLSPENSTLSVGVVGTEPYFSPEQANGGRRDLDSRSDMFSLGITAYAALTGALPFAVNAKNREQFALNRANSVYPPLDTSIYGDLLPIVVGRLLEKYPHNRYRNPRALLVELGKEEVV